MFSSFAAVIDAFGPRPADFGNKLGSVERRFWIASTRVAEMRLRDYVPAAYWPAIEKLAIREGIEGLTRADLAALHIKREARLKGWETAEPAPEAVEAA